MFPKILSTITAATIILLGTKGIIKAQNLTTIFQGIAMNYNGSLQIAITSNEMYIYTINGYWQKASENTGMTGQKIVRMTNDGSSLIVGGSDGWKYYQNCLFDSNSFTLSITNSTGIDSIDTMAMSSSSSNTNIILGTRGRGIWSLWMGSNQFERITRTGVGIGPLMNQIGASAVSLSGMFSYPFSLTQMYQSTDGQSFIGYSTRGVGLWSSYGSNVTITSMVTDDQSSIIGITSDQGVLFSTNLGQTWTSPPSPSLYSGIFQSSSQGMAMSASGTHIAIMSGNLIFYSSNSGTSFHLLFQVNKSPTAIAISSDGSSVTVVGNLFIFQGLGCNSSGCSKINNLSIDERIHLY